MWYLALIFIALFLIITIILWIFPCCKVNLPLTLRSLIKRRLVHISHRGSSAQSVENTIPAFEKAIQSGTEIIEMDVYLTKDKEVVVNHDSDWLRVWGNPSPVKQTHSTELTQLHPLPSYSLHFMSQKYEPTTVQMQTHPPLLKDVFERFPDTFFNIELKDESMDTVMLVSELIDRFHRQDRTIWGIKTSALAQEMKRLQPQVPLFFTPFSGLILCLCCPFLPYLCFNQQVVQFPLFSSASRWVPKQMRDQHGCLIGCLLCVLACFSCCFRLAYCHLKRRGHAIFLWTLNEEEQFVEAEAWGADGIMTDRASLLTRYLQRD